MQQNIEQSREKLSEKEELKEVQSFIDDMNKFGFEYGKNTIIDGENTIRIDSEFQDGGSFINLSLEKNGKEVFVYNMKANMFFAENGEDRPIGVTMKVDGKTMSYSGDENNEHGLYNNFNLLDGAKKYKNEIKEIIGLEEEKKTKLKENEIEINKTLGGLKEKIN